ncbi:natural resistance-associated macrophage protein-domain-containing protein [Rhypophila decipiens]|uniref:Natural resistance-associated macrophage protein-domain-containing protein n=1 Tax=Rhypophila decipiens TaxID=261697 RepID=A0AAN6XYM6_9PEZI|nr:natural resistance-associated macrophage protein-domain-containing protein [Rhypophila decipiens]
MAAGHDSPPIEHVSPPIQAGEAGDAGGADEKRAVIAQVTSSSFSEQQQSTNKRGVFSRIKSSLIIRLPKHSDDDPPPSRVYHEPSTTPAGPASLLSRVKKFFLFFGPGAVISVAYIDPDQYQTGITSGAEFQYKLLFMVLVSNIIAIYIQSLCVKLGTVTGMDLAQMNHRWLPRWLELIIYVVAEASIIATDLGQVIGTAIALNILIPALPLPAACVISVAETLLILLFYSPTGQLRRIRLFEIFVSILVVVVFVTICVALSMVHAPARDVFRGFVPSREIFVDSGLYASCAILGGTLMPHALYVGTALSRARLYDFDTKHSSTAANTSNRRRNSSSSSSSDSTASRNYRPSVQAIKSCLSYSIAELSLTLFTVAIFVNSALVIIAGSAFYKQPDDPSSLDRRDEPEPGEAEVSSDLYSLFDLFSTTIAPAAGIMFAVSLLFSGISAGIVSTIAGQIVMEGAFNIRVSPFLRRLITRLVAIIPALIIAVSVGKEGLSKAMVACNYLLAVALVPITFPVVLYTSFGKYMSVPVVSTREGGEQQQHGVVVGGDAAGEGQTTVEMVNFRNHHVTSFFGWLFWLLVAVMDIATIVLVGLGITVDDG